MIARFRLIALAEAVSWLALIAATVAKRAFDVEEATAVIGPIHGVIFLVYLAAVVFLREELGWPLKRTAVAIAAAVIPLGAYLIVGPPTRRGRGGPTQAGRGRRWRRGG